MNARPARTGARRERGWTSDAEDLGQACRFDAMGNTFAVGGIEETGVEFQAWLGKFAP